MQVDPLSVLGDGGDVLVYALPKSRPPHTHLPPAAPAYTTSTDVDVPCKNEFLFSFFFRLHFPLGTTILSLRLLRPSPDDYVEHKRQREHARVYIYARIISDGGGGEGCNSGRMAARSRGFCRGEEPRGLFDGEAEGEHAPVYTCGRVGGEWYDITTARLFYRPAKNSPYLIRDIEICHFKKSCLFYIYGFYNCN